MNNYTMKNGRLSHKICFKGTLPEDRVTNEECNHRITEDEIDMTTLSLQMSKTQLT